MFTICKTGVTRLVILTKNHAIKIPRWGMICRGILANQSEKQWSGYGEDFCPVLRSWFGGLINIYPRCIPAPDNWIDLYDELAMKTPSDVKRDNFGLYDGKFVWLDYDMSWNDCPRCGQPCSS